MIKLALPLQVQGTLLSIFGVGKSVAARTTIEKLVCDDLDLIIGNFGDTENSLDILLLTLIVVCHFELRVFENSFFLGFEFLKFEL